MTRFRDLNVGDTFDFIKPDSHHNSFYLRCTKVSTRKYTWEQQGQTFTGTVGTINVGVYHVNEEQEK